MTFKDKNIILLHEVGSTNNYANQLILSKQAEEGTVVLTYNQKEGRGQQGNSWESEPGKNILMSIILFPDFLLAENQFIISKTVSLALVEFLSKNCNNVSIKWPNDLYIDHKKIAGILIENGIKGRCLFSSVVGIGLNVNQEKFSSNAPNPISLKQITGMDYNLEEVANEIIDLVFLSYQKLEKGEQKLINTHYFNNLYRKNTWAKFRKEDVEFEAQIVGIGEFGQLKLEKRNGTISEYMFKEVNFLP